MKKLFTLICLCLLAASTSWAQQLYTTFKYGTLNYYYDDQMDSRSGEKEVYDQSKGLSISYKSDVLEANITPSMKDAPLTSTYRMFYGLENMTSIHGLENLNTTNVTNMSRMFYNCYRLTSLDLSSFNTENVTNMGGMFRFCNALWLLDVSSFNTANVTNMGTMFCGCNALGTLDVSSFNTENVTSMESMFVGCETLTALDLSRWDVSNVEDMTDMFRNCRSLEHNDSYYEPGTLYYREKVTGARFAYDFFADMMLSRPKRGSIYAISVRTGYSNIDGFHIGAGLTF